METIKGTVENIIYQNETNGYTVCDIYDNEALITAVGCMPVLNEGETVKVNGDWITHPEYGEQFKVMAYEKIMPHTVESIEKYLASGIVKGVGPSTAKKIVGRFGEQALDIIMFNPLKLAEIKGINAKRAEMIGSSLEEQKGLMDVIIFFQKYGLTPSYSNRIYKVFGRNAIEIARSNPYKLSDEVHGIGFKIADRMAMNLGIEPLSLFRIASGIKYALSQAAADGHTFLPQNVLEDYTSKLLRTSIDSIADALVSLQLEGKVVMEKTDGQTRVYLAAFHLAEKNVSAKLQVLAKHECEDLTGNLEMILKEFEKSEGICFASLQKKAVEKALANGVLIITGGPGTGKTTIIKSIIKVFKKCELSVELAAPTGRAAKRMCEAAGYEARTIHRLLEIGYLSETEVQVFARNEDNPIDADAVIIDEMSMVDIVLFNSLLKAVTCGMRLIMVGDVDQLPSVGPGNVLKDLISSNAVKTVRLTDIFRQESESTIVVNAHKINNGLLPVIDNKSKDFFFLRKSEGDNILNSVMDICSRRLPNKFGYDPMREIQVLAPTKKGIVGVLNLNIELQKLLNPSSKDRNEKMIKEFTFREGDRVMQIKNNYTIRWERTAGDSVIEGEGVFNGDTGIIKQIDGEAHTLTVCFDDEKTVEYEWVFAEQLDPAYAVTIHKSQGSEFPVVVIPLYSGPSVLMTRNLLYTAVTRARDMVILVGREDIIKQMVENKREVARFTGLSDCLAAYGINSCP